MSHQRTKRVRSWRGARELLDGCDRGAKADCVVALTGDLPAKRAGELANRDQSILVYKARCIAVNRRMAKDALAAAEAVSSLWVFVAV